MPSLRWHDPLVFAAPMLLSLLVLLPVTWHSAAAGMFSDAAVYLYMADVSSPWSPAGEIARSVYEAARFPPLYPAVMGLLGLGSGAIPAAHVLNAVLVAVAAGLGALLARARTGSALAASAVGVCIAWSPLMLRLGLELGSEPLFVALVLASLILVERSQGLAVARLAVYAGLVAGLAALTRDVGALLGAAIFLCAALRRSRPGAIGAVAGLMPLLAWHVLRSRNSVVHSYSEHAENLLQQIADGELRFQGGALLFRGWLAGNNFTGARLVDAAGVLLLALALPTWVRRLRECSVDAWFAALYLALFLVFPFPQFADRFVAPLLPVLALFAVETATRARDRLPGGAAARAAGLLLVVAPALFQTPRYASRLALAFPDELMGYRGLPGLFAASDERMVLYDAESNLRLTLAAQQVATRAPEDEPVCTSMPEFVLLHAKRHTRFVAPSAPGADPRVEREATLAACRFLFVVGFPLDRRGQMVPYYPLNLLQDAYRPLLVSRMPADPAQPDREPAVLAALLERQLSTPEARP